MSEHREIILLDTFKYNHDTRKWDVPLLNIPEVRHISLHIEEVEVPSNTYSVEKNFIKFANKQPIRKSTRAYLEIEIATNKNTLVKFWLPILIAVLGVLGTVIQPILNNIGLLYTESDKVEVVNSGISTFLNEQEIVADFDVIRY